MTTTGRWSLTPFSFTPPTWAAVEATSVTPSRLTPSLDAYIAGVTNSSNFPTAGTAYQSAYRGNGDCFVTKINSAGTALIYSTYLGGSEIRHRHGHCLEQRKRLHHRLHRLCGLPHQSADGHWHSRIPSSRLTAAIPTPSSPSSMRPAAPWFTPRIWAAAALDYGQGIAVDSSGNAYVTGSTQSTNFPVTANAPAIQYQRVSECFCHQGESHR